MKYFISSLFLLTTIILPVFAQKAEKITTPISAPSDDSSSKNSDVSEKERWRLILYAGYGGANIQNNPNIPFAYRDPNSGQINNTALGRRTGLTNTGSTFFPSEGQGNNRGSLISFSNHKWFFSYGYTSIHFNMSPSQQGTLPLEHFQAGSDHIVHNSRIDYNQKISDYFTAVFSLRQFVRSGTYQWDNVLESTYANNYYVAFPKVEANDKMTINMFSVGLKFNPIESLELEPYLQYRDARYFVNVFSTVGSIQNASNFLPVDPGAILSTWGYQNLGSAYAVPLYNSISKDFGNVGLRLQYTPLKFLIFRSDVRRNPVLAAWEVRGSFTVMLHKNFGITLGGVYAEREINPLNLRGWEIGPTYTYLF